MGPNDRPMWDLAEVQRDLLLDTLLSHFQPKVAEAQRVLVAEYVENLVSHTPRDFENPAWDMIEKTHCWRNYIGENTRKLWPILDPVIKVMLSVNAAEAAAREDWN